MTYQIYALKYGERDTKESQFFFREASQKPLTLHFFIWVILGGPHPIVVDTGCTAADAQAKELRAFVSPADMLAKVGVKAAEVPVTLVSHLHWDHWGGYSLFPGSTFWMQPSGATLCRSSRTCRRCSRDSRRSTRWRERRSAWWSATIPKWQPDSISSSPASSRSPSRRRIKAHLLRWRPRQQVQRTGSTPHLPPSGAASHLDLSPPPAELS